MFNINNNQICKSITIWILELSDENQHIVEGLQMKHGNGLSDNTLILTKRKFHVYRCNKDINLYLLNKKQ